MKGIMFTSTLPYVLDGTKTVTRRAESSLFEINKEPDKWHLINYGLFQHEGGLCVSIRPRYHVGETAYVKEFHYRWGYWRIVGDKVVFRGSEKVCFSTPSEVLKNSEREKVGWFKSSPLHMPEWAARKKVTFTDVSAVRLLSITKEDALLEGFKETRIREGNGIHWESPTGNFCLAWNSLHAKPKPIKKRGEIICYVSYPWGEETRVETYRGKPHYICGNPWLIRYAFRNGNEHRT